MGHVTRILWFAHPAVCTLWAVARWCSRCWGGDRISAAASADVVSRPPSAGRGTLQTFVCGLFYRWHPFPASACVKHRCAGSSHARPMCRLICPIGPIRSFAQRRLAVASACPPRQFAGVVLPLAPVSRVSVCQTSVRGLQPPHSVHVRSGRLFARRRPAVAPALPTALIRSRSRQRALPPPFAGIKKRAGSPLFFVVDSMRRDHFRSAGSSIPGRSAAILFRQASCSSRFNARNMVSNWVSNWVSPFAAVLGAK